MLLTASVFSDSLATGDENVDTLVWLFCKTVSVWMSPHGPGQSGLLHVAPRAWVTHVLMPTIVIFAADRSRLQKVSSYTLIAVNAGMCGSVARKQVVTSMELVWHLLHAGMDPGIPEFSLLPAGLWLLRDILGLTEVERNDAQWGQGFHAIRELQHVICPKKKEETRQWLNVFLHE